jgi:hypothetical protein
MPIIVGAPRSGTTLMRLMLDAHPNLAIPPETGFLGQLAPLQSAGAGPAELIAFIAEFPPDAPAWQDYGVDRDALLTELCAMPAFTVGDGVRAFYRAYAARHGKARWGDKTPAHALVIPELVAVLPEARIIHVIRDGRDVAASLRQRWFSPGHDIGIQAEFWGWHVRAARHDGPAHAPYLEVRFEDLVREPRRTLEEVCAFVHLPFDEQMLRSHERAPQRLAEHRERRARDGSLVVSHEARFDQQRRTTTPPDPQRIGTWRDELTPEDAAGFLAAEGALLAELGYLDADAPARSPARPPRAARRTLARLRRR